MKNSSEKKILYGFLIAFSVMLVLLSAVHRRQGGRGEVSDNADAGREPGAAAVDSEAGSVPESLKALHRVRLTEGMRAVADPVLRALEPDSGIEAVRDDPPG